MRLSMYYKVDYPIIKRCGNSNANHNFGQYVYQLEQKKMYSKIKDVF